MPETNAYPGLADEPAAPRQALACLTYALAAAELQDWLKGAVRKPPTPERTGGHVVAAEMDEAGRRRATITDTDGESEVLGPRSSHWLKRSVGRSCTTNVWTGPGWELGPSGSISRLHECQRIRLRTDGTGPELLLLAERLPDGRVGVTTLLEEPGDQAPVDCRLVRQNGPTRRALEAIAQATAGDSLPDAECPMVTVTASSRDPHCHSFTRLRLEGWATRIERWHRAWLYLSHRSDGHGPDLVFEQDPATGERSVRRTGRTSGRTYWRGRDVLDDASEHVSAIEWRARGWVSWGQAPEPDRIRISLGARGGIALESDLANGRSVRTRLVNRQLRAERGYWSGRPGNVRDRRIGEAIEWLATALMARRKTEVDGRDQG